jgi:hypothetical protein
MHLGISIANFIFSFPCQATGDITLCTLRIYIPTVAGHYPKANTQPQSSFYYLVSDTIGLPYFIRLGDSQTDFR